MKRIVGLLMTAAILVAPASAMASQPSVIGIGDVPGCAAGTSSPVPWLRVYDAQVLRVLVNQPHFGQYHQCIAQAERAGARLELVIQYCNNWSLAQDRAWFKRVLEAYSPARFVAVGNEQELAQCGRGENGKQYATVWRAVKPLIRQYDPAAKLLAGEGSPWSIPYLTQALQSGLPGAQALAAHPYHMARGAPISEFLTLANRYRLPLWADEGLAGPYACPGGKVNFTRAEIRGAAMAAAWLK